MALPQEILDKILEHISVDRWGRQTLIACTLVATWWTGPSQRRLFSSVEIDERNYQRWMDGVVLSGSNLHLLAYIRSLEWRPEGTRYRMRDLEKYSGEYFSALRNIRNLTLYNVKVEHISEGGFHTCFSAFRETLTYLSFDTFATSFSAFVTLVDYFPNITTLQLRSFVLKPDEGPVPPLSRPLRGKLHIHRVQSNYLEFLDRFTKLDLEYEELIIDSPYVFMDPKFVERALRISPSTVKFLRLTAVLHCERSLPVFLVDTARLPEFLVLKPNLQ